MWPVSIVCEPNRNDDLLDLKHCNNRMNIKNVGYVLVIDYNTVIIMTSLLYCSRQKRPNQSHQKIMIFLVTISFLLIMMVSQSNFVQLTGLNCLAPVIMLTKCSIVFKDALFKGLDTFANKFTDNNSIKVNI